MRSVKLVLIVMAWHNISSVDSAKSGPYKATWIKVEKCQNPTKPIDKDPMAGFYGELYNTTKEINLMRGNITIYREELFKKLQMKSFLWFNNKWKLIYVINNMGCSRVFFPLAAMMANLRYDMKTCMTYKGVYSFSNLDVNKSQHMWMKTQVYGRVLQRFEAFSYKGSMICYDFETMIVPE